MIVTGGNHAGEFLRLLGNGDEFGLDRLLFAYQERPGGIAEALGLCERFVDGDKVVVMLADNILGRSIAPYVERFQQQDVRRPRPARRGRRPRAPASPRRAELRQDDRLDVASSRSPRPAEPVRRDRHLHLRRRGLLGLPTLKPSGRGELEITDVNNAYVERGAMEYDVIEGFWGDAGESIDVYYSVNDFVRRFGANR